MPGIHVVGDAINPGEMPKSAFAANSQAKVCAMAVAALLDGRDPFEARFFNTCWSFVGIDDAVKVGASYRIVEGKIKAVEKFISKVGESAETRKQRRPSGGGLVCRHQRRRVRIITKPSMSSTEPAASLRARPPFRAWNPLRGQAPCAGN